MMHYCQAQDLANLLRDSTGAGFAPALLTCWRPTTQEETAVAASIIRLHSNDPDHYARPYLFKTAHRHPHQFGTLDYAADAT